MLLDPGGGFRSKTAVMKPFRKWNGYKFITTMCNGHSPTEKSVRPGVTCKGFVTAVAIGQSQRLYSGVGIFNWHYLSSPPQTSDPTFPGGPPRITAAGVLCNVKPGIIELHGTGIGIQDCTGTVQCTGTVPVLLLYQYPPGTDTVWQPILLI